MPDLDIKSLVIKKKLLEAVDDITNGRNEPSLLKVILVVQRLASRNPDSEEPLEEPLPAKKS